MTYCILYLQEKKTEATLREKEAQLDHTWEISPASSLHISGVDRSPTCPSDSQEPKGDYRAERPLPVFTLCSAVREHTTVSMVVDFRKCQ